MTDLRK